MKYTASILFVIAFLILARCQSLGGGGNGDCLDCKEIIVSGPHGGVVFETMKTNMITWSSSLIEGKVDIQLFKGGIWVKDISTDQENDGEYFWFVPLLEEGSDYQVRVASIQSPEIYGESDYFTIRIGISDANFSNYTIEDLAFDDKSIRLYTGGDGNTTIIFEHGLGGDADVWFTNQLIDFIDDDNQFIAYNRSGYTPSTYNGEARDLPAITSDLHEIINQKCPENDLILVGWSWGGAIIRYYAIHYPTQVKALLFVDPSHEDFFATMTQEQEDERVQEFENAGNTGAALEAMQMREVISQLSALGNLPDIPTVVLSKNVNAKTTHAKLGEGVTDFTHIVTNTGHAIQMEKPYVVYENLKILVEKVKGQ